MHTIFWTLGWAFSIAALVWLLIWWLLRQKAAPTSGTASGSSHETRTTGLSTAEAESETGNGLVPPARGGITIGGKAGSAAKAGETEPATEPANPGKKAPISLPHSKPVATSSGTRVIDIRRGPGAGSGPVTDKLAEEPEVDGSSTNVSPSAEIAPSANATENASSLVASDKSITDSPSPVPAAPDHPADSDDSSQEDVSPPSTHSSKPDADAALPSIQTASEEQAATIFRTELDEGTVRQDAVYGIVYLNRPDEIDDLKQIKGVAEVLEGKLHDIGVYRFRQIAVWTGPAVKEFSKLLTSFKNRIYRDDWIAQAKNLHEKKYGEKL